MLNYKPKKKKKIGLALGGGAARGGAHIGVIKALTEAGINIDFIAGTSIGALVGAVYASGEIDLFEEVASRLNLRQSASLFLDVKFPRSGIVDGRKIVSFLQQFINVDKIEDLSIPFCAVSTDLNSGEEVIMREGSVIEAIRASISIPGIFTPVRKNGLELVDGGLVNPVPVSVVQKMGADFVIAVDLNRDLVPKNELNVLLEGSLEKHSTDAHSKLRRAKLTDKIIRSIQDKAGVNSSGAKVLTSVQRWINEEPLPNIFDVIMSSLKVMQVQISDTNLKLNPPDILLQPRFGNIRALEFHRFEESIAAGYEAAAIQLHHLG